MSEQTGPNEFGRVAEDGTVYVRTAEGERSVGQIPDATPAEALAFFTRRYNALETEVRLLEQRLTSGTVAPEDARRSVNSLKKSISGANAVGDLAALLARLDALEPMLAQAAEARKAEKAKANEEARAAKEAKVAEAEKLAQSNDWRGGVNRFRQLLDEWKALPRLDRATDDELWHRFSAARTTYTRRRKTQFAQQNEKRAQARVIKQGLIAEAREIATLENFGAAAGGFRDLMQRWKAAGPAPRDVDDKLWAEFRGIQDEFFNRRNEQLAEQDAEFKVNQDAKEALLSEYEPKIKPVNDLEASKAAFREFLEKYNEHGKVPRDAIRPLEQRVRSLEQAVRQAEEAEWKRTDPEARKRAEETVAMFESHIAKLEKQASEAEAKGDAKKLRDAQQSMATYQSWLDQARATLADFTR